MNPIDLEECLARRIAEMEAEIAQESRDLILDGQWEELDRLLDDDGGEAC